MKSKLFTLILICVAFISFAQPTKWTTSEPGGQGNDIKFTKEETTVNEGTYSAKIDLYGTGTPYIYSAEFDVTAGSSYTFSIDVLDNAAAYYKIYCEFLDAAGDDIYGEAPISTDDNADWQTITWSATVPTDAVKGYVWIKLYDDAGFTAPATMYLDNASFIMDGGSNLIPNGGFEEWVTAPKFESFKFASLDPEVIGVIDATNFTVDLTVPYDTDVTTLVPTFEVATETTVEVEASGVYSTVTSGTTAVDFTNARTFKLTKDTKEQVWTVTVIEEDPSDEKQILSFVFAGLNPEVRGEIDQNAKTIDLAVPTGTTLTDLVPTIQISELATVSPKSDVAQDFSSAVTYTVTAQDETTQDYTVTVTETDEVVIFQEFFENTPYVIPDDWTLLENDNYTPNAGDERWADSAWVVTTTGRPELLGTHVAMALTYYSDMPSDGRTNDWLITPAISLQANSTLSWKAMSTTSSGNYPDDYRVIIAPASTSVDPTESYFETYGEILMEIDDESWSAAVGNPGNGIAERSIALKDAGQSAGYTNMDVWIAFVCITGDGGGSNLAIDDVKVVEGASSTGIFDATENELTTSIYPNPSNGLFKLAVKSEVKASATIEIYDLVGRVLYSEEMEVENGQNILDVDATQFEKGIYLVNTRINNKENTTKLVIE